MNNHEDNHGKMSVVLFFLGLLSFIIALAVTSTVLSTTLFLAAMLLSGYHVIAEGVVETYEDTREKKKFTPNVHILMGLAAIGAAILGNYTEGALLILIFAGAHFMEEYVEGRSQREITSLLKLNPQDAQLIMPDGSLKLVHVDELKVGDKIAVLNGAQVPTDGIVISGASSIDESSINGESVPAEKTIGDLVFGSTINGNSRLDVEVTKESSDTVFAKIMALVEQSQSNQSKTATKIKLFEPKYVNVVLLLVTLYIVLTPILTSVSWADAFYKGMVYLTVASPCALAASAVPATLSGISNLAKKGVLFKGGAYLSNLADIKAIGFDKTGTLTKGKPVLVNSYFDVEDNQEYLDIIVAMEKHSNHPLSKAIIEGLPPEKVLDIVAENKVGEGLIAEYNGDKYSIGKPSVFNDVEDDFTELNEQYSKEGKTVVYFAKNDVVTGLLSMMDLPNENALPVIEYFKEQGIATAMITGDAKLTGEAVAKLVNVDEVFSNVLPEEKSKIVKELQSKYGMTAMLGDGVNDAPALVDSDIGVAMGDGTDVAIDVADVVLMKNDLSKLSYAHKVSKKLDKVIKQNMIFSMGVVALLVVLNTFNMMDLTVGVIAHEGSTILVLLNGLRLLKDQK